LIKEPGLYKLERVTIELLPGFTSQDQRAPAGGFFVFLPVVFRRGGGDDYLVLPGRKIGAADIKGKGAFLCAADRWGIAAFIGLEAGEPVVASRRDMPGAFHTSPGNGGFDGIYYCKVSRIPGV
jgi:hypothetical protein